MPNTPENSESVSVRDRLLDAAEQIVARNGVSNLTLEAVAHEAGVSKGGLLYHFPAKSALIAAIVARYGDRCESKQAAAIAADTQPSGSFTRAYLITGIEPPDPQTEPVHTAILAALGTDPEYLDPIRQRAAAWQARLESDGIDPVIASIVRLAVDGLVLDRLLKLPVPEAGLLEKVIARLLAMTQPQTEKSQT